MPGLLHITLTALLASCDVFALGVSRRPAPLGPPAHRRLRDGDRPTQPRLLQELVRTKRSSAQELVRTQPHLVHDMGWPEIHETSRSRAKPDSDNSSQPSAPPAPGQGAAKTHDAVDENRGVEDAMERMVHLTVPQDSEDYRERPEKAADPEAERLGGPGEGDASREASGFCCTDAEDRERRAGGEDEWEREKMAGDGETRGGDAREEEEEDEEEEEEERERRTQDVLDLLEVNHTTPDLDALIGYSPSFHPSGSQQPFPAEVHDSGPQEHRVSPVLEAGLLGKELWEAELEEDVQSSGYGVPRSSVTAVTSTVASFTPPPPPPPAAAAAAGDSAGTASPETDTGTDFGLLGSYTRDEKQEDVTESREEDEEDEEAGLTRVSAFTQKPTAPEVGLAPSREPLQPSVEEEEQQQREAGHRLEDSDDEEEAEGSRNGHMIPLTTGPFPTWDWPLTTPLHTQQQIVCLDWSELAGRGYVVLNMTQNLNCEEFRVDQGVRLLRVMERVFARRMNSPAGSWMIYLSKPTHQQHQLLMNVASENGVIATKDVLDMLGEIRKCLDSVGIQNYSAASSCQSRPSQTRSDYGKLFVVLVIIGSICMVIITSGFIYICWQRRLPAAKTTFRAEELHFVENGCHDNPMLDVTNDGQPEMREKKPSTNGLAGGGGEGGGEESSRWQVFVNQAATEEDEEEQDTHL